MTVTSATAQKATIKVQLAVYAAQQEDNENGGGAEETAMKKYVLVNAERVVEVTF